MLRRLEPGSTQRIKLGLPLNKYDRDTLYTFDARLHGLSVLRRAYLFLTKDRQACLDARIKSSHDALKDGCYISSFRAVRIGA
jgi:hypothetical protein